jgi:hypothetical protein
MSDHYHEQRELEVKHEMKKVDMSHYTKDMWFDEMEAYLTLIMTPQDPKPPEKPLTKEGLAKQKIRVKAMVKYEFDTRFADLLDRGLGL